jgi:hypothetical protein
MKVRRDSDKDRTLFARLQILFPTGLLRIQENSPSENSDEKIESKRGRAQKTFEGWETINERMKIKCVFGIMMKRGLIETRIYFRFQRHNEEGGCTQKTHDCLL